MPSIKVLFYSRLLTQKKRREEANDHDHINELIFFIKKHRKVVKFLYIYIYMYFFFQFESKHDINFFLKNIYKSHQSKKLKT